jgi:hypothetical protein
MALNMKHLHGSLVFAALTLLSTAANAAVLTLDATNKLIGATDVMVNGAAYDVQFKDGKCSDLYGGCDAASDFIFNTEVTARDASLALLNQVFNAFPTYDLDPSLTNGCPPNFYSYYFDQTMGACSILTPFKVMPMLGSAELQVATFLTLNEMRDLYDAVPALGNNVVMTQFADTNTGYANPPYIYAVWAAAGQTKASVPEPASLALISLGLGLMGWTARRKI